MALTGVTFGAHFPIDVLVAARVLPAPEPEDVTDRVATAAPVAL